MLGKKTILIGYSGHGYVIADTALENHLNLIGYTEKFAVKNNPFNLNYFGDESSQNYNGWDIDANYLIGVGDNTVREKIFVLIKNRGKEIITLINSSAAISKYAKIGEGTFVNKNVSVNAFANIGNNVILNTACIIEHECTIADSVHIAPGVVLAGNVTIGERSFIGANAVIKQGVVIGKDVVVGAGTVVLNSIPDFMKVVGNPNRII